MIGGAAGEGTCLPQWNHASEDILPRVISGHQRTYRVRREKRVGMQPVNKPEGRYAVPVSYLVDDRHNHRHSLHGVAEIFLQNAPYLRLDNGLVGYHFAVQSFHCGVDKFLYIV